jgi:peptidoglycan/LPS O-acetylase OafA/YrhL
MAMPGPSLSLGYRPALDGLRAIAVLLVLFQHSGLIHLDRNGSGTTGVTLFFVLSGYLITTLLRREHRDTGRIDFRAFYARRVRRLLPALAFFLPIVSVFLLAIGQSLLPVALTVGYASNIAAAAGANLAWLGHTWTLSMEEQFYFAWPFLLPFVVRRRPVLVLTLAAAASVALRTGLWLNGASVPRIYYGPDVRVEAILIGCALAFITLPTRHLRPAAAISAGLLVVGCVVCTENRLVWLLTPIAVASAVLIGWAIHDEPRFLATRPLVGLGKISYGLYLWQLPVALVVNATDLPLGVRLGLLLTFSVGMATLSWYLIERPFSHRRHPVPQVSPDSNEGALVVDAA